MKFLFTFACFCLLPLGLPAEVDDPVAQLMSTFERRVEETSLQKELKVFRLRPLYLGRLQQVYDRAVADGDPHLAQAVLQEQERFSASNLVAEPLSDQEAIRELQERWLALALQANRSQAKEVLGLYERLDQALARMERSLTSEGNIDEALRVREKRNALTRSEEYERFSSLALGEPPPEEGLETAASPIWVKEVRSSTPVCSRWPQHNMKQAFDSNPETRWQGDNLEGEWLEADFHRPMNVDRVVITWEVAHAKSYQIHVRIGQTWRKVAETQSGKTGRMTHPVNLTGVEGLRIDNMQAGTEWPPSIFTIEVD